MTAVQHSQQKEEGVALAQICRQSKTEQKTCRGVFGCPHQLSTLSLSLPPHVQGELISDPTQQHKTEKDDSDDTIKTTIHQAQFNIRLRDHSLPKSWPLRWTYPQKKKENNSSTRKKIQTLEYQTSTPNSFCAKMDLVRGRINVIRI